MHKLKCCATRFPQSKQLAGHQILAGVFDFLKAWMAGGRQRAMPDGVVF